MTNLNQQILKFDYEQNFKDQDFYVSNSNEHSFSLLNSWPKWEKNFINLIGEKFSECDFGNKSQNHKKQPILLGKIVQPKF